MGGNAKKKRIIAAKRHDAKEKAATKKEGPTTSKVESEKRVKNPTPQPDPQKQTTTQKRWTGKAPIDLLHEYLQKEKWARARWVEQNTSQDIFGKPLFTWKVSVFNPKTEEKHFFRTYVFADKLDPSDQKEEQVHY